MSVHTHEQQSMLVAIGFGNGIIVATESEIIKHEVTEVSPHLDDHFAKKPAESGIYVWEGSITVDAGGWVGSEPIDPDISWSGAFRKATAADIARFGL